MRLISIKSAISLNISQLQLRLPLVDIFILAKNVYIFNLGSNLNTPRKFWKLHVLVTCGSYVLN